MARLLGSQARQLALLLRSELVNTTHATVHSAIVVPPMAPFLVCSQALYYTCAHLPETEGSGHILVEWLVPMHYSALAHAGIPV